MPVIWNKIGNHSQFSSQDGDADNYAEIALLNTAYLLPGSIVTAWDTGITYRLDASKTWVAFGSVEPEAE